MEKELISIIIPTFKREDILGETLDSILSQTYKNIEVILVSDGPSKETKTLTDQYRDDRLKYFELPENSGRPAVARNYGLRKARGKFIALCDDDDIWQKNKIENQWQILKKDSSIKLTSSNAQLFPIRETDVFVSKLFSKRIGYNYLLNNKNCIITSSVLFLREVYDEIGGMDESMKLKSVEDYDYWLQIVKKWDNSIYFYNSNLLKYRVNHDKILERANQELSINKRVILVLQKHLPLSSNFVIIRTK